MVTENQTETPGAAPGGEGAPLPATPPGGETAPKLELKEGAIFVDGKKMVKESDLMALKQSSESAAEKAQAAHVEAIDAKSLELSAALQNVADLNAKSKEALEKAQGLGATSDEEVARIKMELTDALTKVETLTADAGKALELKRALLVLQGFTADSLAEKTMTQLDSLEEAAKALAASRGGSVGNYAIGGGTGGAAPKTNIERAAEVIANTPQRGVREPVTSEQK
jgi:hypothetical protein